LRNRLDGGGRHDVRTHYGVRRRGRGHFVNGPLRPARCPVAREIEAHTHELGDTDSGRYFINEASHLLGALRLWAQSQYRTDHVVRDILEAGDVVALHDVSRELQEIGTHDAQSAGWSITTITNRSSGELMTIGSYALRAL
jgi:hypothetical protein